MLSLTLPPTPASKKKSLGSRHSPKVIGRRQSPRGVLNIQMELSSKNEVPLRVPKRKPEDTKSAGKNQTSVTSKTRNQFSSNKKHVKNSMSFSNNEVFLSIPMLKKDVVSSPQP